MNGLIIRPYRSSDADALAQVFHQAVHNGAGRHYTPQQRQAWAPAPPTGPDWHTRLHQADTIVAELSGEPVGFMTLDLDEGYLDFAYVAPSVMGKGVAQTLYAVLEGRARAKGLTRLDTDASLLAERFFLRRGWSLVARQEVERKGVKIPNARMEKHLSPKEAAA